MIHGMKKQVRRWGGALVSSTIQGGASAGSAWLTTNGAHAAGVDVPALNLKCLLIITVTGALAAMYGYLKEKPLPLLDNGNGGGSGDTTITTKTPE
jgi:hypothetical protein